MENGYGGEGGGTLWKRPGKGQPDPAIVTAAPDGRDAPSGTLLPHLAGPASGLRQVLAAHAVRRCHHIVEIGGAGLPITGFLTHRPKSVTVIDPKIGRFRTEVLNGAPCDVRHVDAKLQAVTLPVRKDVALVLLGLSLKAFGAQEAVPAQLLAMAKAARVLVIDYALDLPRAQGQIGALLASRTDRPAIDLAMTIEDEALKGAGFDRRRFVAFGTV